MMPEISILCTGGTFDKSYAEGAGVRNFSFAEKTVVQDMIARFGFDKITVSYDVQKAKDSLDMTEEDRDHIATWCATNTNDRLVVIHGTDTLVKTAAVIAARCPQKTVILTGALQPARMRDSDAEFNLGGAVAAAQIATPGVYIVMSGKVFPWNKCQKNQKTGQFESL